MHYSPLGSTCKTGLPGKKNGLFYPATRKAALFMLAASCLFAPACSFFTSSEQQTASGLSETENFNENSLSNDALLAYKHLVLNESLGKGDFETALQMVNELLVASPTPDLYRQAVLILDQNNRPEDALKVAREGVLSYPDDFSLHMLLAELLERQNDIESALELLHNYALRYNNMTTTERELRMHELSSIRQFMLYMMLNNKNFNEAYDYINTIPKSERSTGIRYCEILILRHYGEDKLARKKLIELVNEDPTFTDGWLVLAHDMDKAGDYETAVRYYEKAYQSAPVPELFLQLLKARLKAGETNEAFEQVITTPIGPELQIRSALVFMDNKNFAHAKHILLPLQNVQHIADDVTLYLGMIAYDTGENMEEALQSLQDISQDAPNRARMLYLKTILHVRFKDYAAAYASATMLRDEYPDTKEHWSLLAELAMAAKQYTEAEHICKEALDQWPDDPAIMYSLSMSFYNQKRPAESIALLEDIIDIDDTNVMALNALGYTLAEEKRDLERALALISTALKLEPNNTGILDSLAWVYYQIGNYTEAWKTIKKCAAQGVTDAIIWDHYGDIALAVNDKKSAIMGYTRALELNPENRKEITKKLGRLR